MGFYLQEVISRMVLPNEFWRKFVQIPNVLAIKIAPFNRYQTLDVLEAVANSGRAGEIALYTGNDDNIVVDLLTEFRVADKHVYFSGGLLGHWAVWTKRAVELLAEIKAARANRKAFDLLARSAEITDANAVLFDEIGRAHV